MRVALLISIPAPYRIPVYRDLAETPGWTLRIFASAESEFDRSWQVDAKDLDIVTPRSLAIRQRVSDRGIGVRRVVTRHLPIGLFSALCHFRPDVVIGGELGLRSLVALAYARLMGTPLVIWSYHARAAANRVGRLRRAWRRWLLARADAVVGMGVQTREVLEALGVPASRLFDAPNAHDCDTWERARARLDPALHGTTLRVGLGCRSRIALVVGRLVPSKGITPLLEAWETLPDDLRDEWTLLFVGSGPCEAEIDRARARHSAGAILRVPSVQPEEVVDFYAAADLLVFPTLWEPWGLVVNEALACGIPVLCSQLAGCADDLIETGRNGWCFDPTRPEEFLDALVTALSDDDLRGLGEAGRRMIEAFGPERMAKGLRDAVDHARRGSHAS
jgi:glycosyltransferase involved in cell wall biosynthesis